MPLSAKKRAAHDARLRLLARDEEKRRSPGSHKKEKQLVAEATIVRFYSEQRERLRETKSYAPLTCEAKIDRVALAVSKVNKELLKALRTIPGYGVPKTQKLWGQGYGWAERMKGNGSIRELILLYDKQAGWLPPLRIVIHPRDMTGLLYEDLRHILELLPDFEIRLIEIALDFPVDSIVDMAYVRRHCLFGKLRPRSVGRSRIWDLWGTR